MHVCIHACSHAHAHRHALAHRNYLDLLNDLLFTYSLSLRLEYILWVYARPVPLPTHEYPAELEELAALQRKQTQVIYLYMYICIYMCVYVCVCMYIYVYM